MKGKKKGEGAAPLRVAPYARVSTGDQSPQMQVDALRDFLRAKGWSADRFYVDHGQSGAKDSRPELDAMMEKVRAEPREIDLIVVWKLDRLGRSSRHLVNVLDELRRRGVEFVSVTESIDTSTAMGRMVYTILAAVAEMDRENILERAREGRDRARARGVRFGRPQRWTEDQAARARELREAGESWRKIAQSVGLPVRTIRRAVAQLAPRKAPRKPR